MWRWGVGSKMDIHSRLLTVMLVGRHTEKKLDGSDDNENFILFSRRNPHGPRLSPVPRNGWGRPTQEARRGVKWPGKGYM